MTIAIQKSCWAVGYYVMDEVGSVGVVAGPFDTAEAARTDLHEYNIADDCGVWHRDTNGQFRAVAS